MEEQSVRKLFIALPVHLCTTYHCNLRVWASPMPNAAIKLLFLTQQG